MDILFIIAMILAMGIVGFIVFMIFLFSIVLFKEMVHFFGGDQSGRE